MALLYEHHIQDKVERVDVEVALGAVTPTVQTEAPGSRTVTFGTAGFTLVRKVERASFSAKADVSFSGVAPTVQTTSPGSRTVEFGVGSLSLESAQTFTVDRGVSKSVSFAGIAPSVQTTAPGTTTVDFGVGALSLSQTVESETNIEVQASKSVSFGSVAVGVTTSGSGSTTVEFGVASLSLSKTVSFSVSAPSPEISQADINNDFADNYSILNAYWTDTASPYTVEVYQGSKDIRVYQETGVTTTDDYSSSSFDTTDQTDRDEFDLKVIDDNGNSDTYTITP